MYCYSNNTATKYCIIYVGGQSSLACILMGARSFTGTHLMRSKHVSSCKQGCVSVQPTLLHTQAYGCILYFHSHSDSSVTPDRMVGE